MGRYRTGRGVARRPAVDRATRVDRDIQKESPAWRSSTGLASDQKSIPLLSLPDFFAISPHRVRNLIRKGEIPALRVGRSYRTPRKAEAEYRARPASNGTDRQ